MYTVSSGGSRISRWGGADPWGGADLRRGRFSVKMYVKTKELGPVGHAPRTANVKIDTVRSVQIHQRR